MFGFIIAQYAAPGYWDKHYDVDPGETGLHSVHSIHRTSEGLGIQKVYTEKEHRKAIEDCNSLNNRHPGKGYAVVRVL